MSPNGRVGEIAGALAGVRRELEALEAAGHGIPAVEKNVLRLRGTLRALEVQFADLHALWRGDQRS
ncbi:MAG: hypothetical protein ACYDA8_09445 [Deferrisomatales bacterium]